MSDTTQQAEAQPGKISNDDRRMQKLHRKAQRAHEWRVRVWAEMELSLRSTNAEIEVLGGTPFVPWEPDFKSEESLRNYSKMTITK